MDQTSARHGSDIGTRYADNIKQGEWTQEHMATFITDFEDNKRRKVKHRKNVLEEIVTDENRLTD